MTGVASKKASVAVAIQDGDTPDPSTTDTIESCDVNIDAKRASAIELASSLVGRIQWANPYRDCEWLEREAEAILRTVARDILGNPIAFDSELQTLARAIAEQALDDSIQPS